MCFLPWAVLPGQAAGTVLLEDYAMSVVPSAQMAFTLLSSPQATEGGLLLVGDVDYDQSVTAESEKNGDTGRPPRKASRSREVPPQMTIGAGTGFLVRPTKSRG